MRSSLAVVLFGVALAAGVLVAGCPGPPPPAPPAVASAPITSATRASSGEIAPESSADASAFPDGLVALDATDGLELPEPLARQIAAARAKIPSTLTAAQRTALEDLESRSERLEAAADGHPAESEDAPRMADPAATARVLAGFFWERLRLFDPELPPETPEALVKAFEDAVPRPR